MLLGTNRRRTVILKEPVDIWQGAQQRPCADVAADLSCGPKRVQRASLTVTDGVHLGVHAALGSANQASSAVRAGRCPVSLQICHAIITVSSSPYSAVRPAIIPTKIPLSFDSFQRLYQVLCRPGSLGASRPRVWRQHCQTTKMRVAKTLVRPEAHYETSVPTSISATLACRSYCDRGRGGEAGAFVSSRAAQTRAIRPCSYR